MDHIHHPIVQLAMYATLFDCKVQLACPDNSNPELKSVTEMDGGFVAWFCIFREQLSWRLPELSAETTYNVPRLPMLVEIQGEWRVHHIGRKCWYRCKDIRHALLLWTLLVGNLFNGELVTQHSLRTEGWLDLFAM